MDVNKELDRIQKAGCSVTLRWNRSVRFIGPLKYSTDGKKPVRTINFSKMMKKDDLDFNKVIMQAIIEFDEKHPNLL